MNKVNIANYVVYDLANRFSVSEQNNDVVELIAEDWGGSTVFCPVSAHTKEGNNKVSPCAGK